MSFERVTMDGDHVYSVGGAVVPGVTTICEIIAPLNLSFAAPVDLAYRRDIGIAVHEMTANDDYGILDESTVSEELRPYLEAWRAFRREKHFELQEAELRIYSAKHRYAGTLDRRGTVNGRPAILDIKTGTVDLAYVGPQTAAYEFADREWAGIGGRPRDRFAVKLNDDGAYALIPCRDKRDIDVFLYGLQIWNWRQVRHASY